MLSVKANLLASRGHEVSIVVLRLKGRKPFFPIDPSVNIVDLSAPCLSLPGHPSSANATSDSPRTTVSSAVGSTSSPASCSARTENITSSPSTMVSERLKGSVRKRLSRVVEMLDPDVCVSLCGPEVRILPAAAGGRPCVAEYHFSHDKFYRKYGGIFMYPYAWLRTHMLERAVSEYDCMVTLTEHDLPIWKRHCRRVERIFNPVTTPPGQVSRLAEKRMIAVGRLEDQKNFKDLVSAWSIVAERFPDWRLEIFGEGKLEHALRSQIARLGLTGSVILRGVVKDIASEYSNSSALLMTSLHEGFPLALVEASSFGLPLISYDCPTGPSEIIVDAGDGGFGNVPAATLDQAAGNTPNGYLVPVGDVRTLADRICRIASDDNLRLRLGAASKASSRRFTPETIISAWEHLFSSLL